MFENMTYDNIINSMLADIDLDVRKDEGSLIFNSLSKQALQLEQAYINLSYMYDQLLATTMNRENLLMYGEERGVHYKDGTQCYLECNIFRKTSGEPFEVKNGMRFYSGDYVYEVVQKLDAKDTYEIVCVEAGNIPSRIGQNIYPVDWLNNFAYGVITALRVAGRDDEDIEVYRQRVIDSFNPRGFSGNKRSYIDKLNEYDGIGGCKVKRRNPETGYIDITLQGSNYYSVPQSLIETIQEDVDPARDGEGDGWCPICHRVNIQSVGQSSIGVQARIICKEGYSLDATMRENINTAITGYFTDLNKKWANEEVLNVSPSGIATYILDVEGVEDVPLESGSENVFLLTYKKDGELKTTQNTLKLTTNAIGYYNSTSEYTTIVQSIYV